MNRHALANKAHLTVQRHLLRSPLCQPQCEVHVLPMANIIFPTPPLPHRRQTVFSVQDKRKRSHLCGGRDFIHPLLSTFVAPNIADRLSRVTTVGRCDSALPAPIVAPSEKPARRGHCQDVAGAAGHLFRQTRGRKTTGLILSSGKAQRTERYCDGGIRVRTLQGVRTRADATSPSTGSGRLAAVSSQKFNAITLLDMA